MVYPTKRYRGTKTAQLNNAEGPKSPNNLIRWPAAARKYPYVKLRPIKLKKMYNISIESQKTRDLIVRAAFV